MPNYTLQQIDPTKLRVWIAGRPAEIWLGYRDIVGNFVKKNKLKPPKPEEYPYLPTSGEIGEFEGMVSRSKTKLAIRWPFPFPGGIRAAHVHYGPDVYLLNQKQWNSFTKQVMKDVQNRISKTEQVSFEEALQITEAVVPLNR